MISYRFYKVCDLSFQNWDGKIYESRCYLDHSGTLEQRV